MTDPHPAIRPFADRDRPFRARAARELRPGATASPRDPALLDAYFDRFGRGDAGDWSDAFVAVDAADRAIGLVALVRQEDPFTGHPRAYVDALVVDPDARGRGVGAALLRFAEAWARERGCREVCLDVFAGNAGAIAFYERVGFRPDHVRLAKPLA